MAAAPRDLDIVLYSELTDTVPQPRRVSWEALANDLLEHDERREKDGPGWSATVYRKQATRGKKGVEEVTALVLDVDHDEPQWSLLDGLEYVAHTTWKHHAHDEHEDCHDRRDCPHWRIVLPLADPVPIAEWDSIRNRARFWLCPNADESAKDAPRFFWLPTAQPGNVRDSRRQRGVWLDPYELRKVPADEPARRVIPPPSAPADGDRPGDRFEREADWCRDLLPDWKPVGVHGDNLMMRRPGSTNPYGATISQRGQGVLYVFTDGAPPLQPDTCYSKFGAFATLDHGGDFKAAAGVLAKRYRMSAASIGRIGTNGTAEPGHEEPTLPEIYADEQDLRIVTGQAWDAIEQRNERDPYLFRYDDAPVRVEQDANERPVLRMLAIDHVRHELARLAVWWGMRGPKAEKIRTVLMPPLAVCRDVLATPNQPLPIVQRVVACPIFGPDGALQVTSGYNVASRTYLAIPPSLRVPAVANRPTADDVAKARAMIVDDMLADFPFVRDSDLAHAVALSLEPFARAMIDGPIPLHNIEAPTAGSGKGLLADILMRPSCGKSVATITPANDDDEWRKSLHSMVSQGYPAIRIDNVVKTVNSGVLSMAITEDPWTVRTLGVSHSVSVPVRCSWIMTGNNPSFSTEMARRTVTTRLDPKVDRPQDRENWRHPDIRDWADRHRGELAWALCTLVRAWVVSGQKQFSGRALGSFESWSRVIGGVLEHVGIGGFLANQREVYEISDLETTVWQAFILAWWEQFQTQEVGAKDLFPIALGIEGLDLGSGQERSQKTKFGMLLLGQRDRIIAGYAVKQGRKDHRVQQWCLLPGELSL